MAPPIVSPAVRTNTASEVPPTRARTPRREMVAADGSGATRSLSTDSGRVPASPVRNSVRNDRERRARTMSPNFTHTWITNPAMKAQAP